jgi:Heterokaryon incompatibility protein (HET)
MRLLNTETLKVHYFKEDLIPVYAILSHTWAENEVTFQQISLLSHSELADKGGFIKIKQFCKEAVDWGFTWVWIDTCCIDKTSSTELSEAINSMFQWYQQSSACFTYLSDVNATKSDFEPDNINHDDDYKYRSESFEKSRWFLRGWCL